MNNIPNVSNIIDSHSPYSIKNGNLNNLIKTPTQLGDFTLLLSKRGKCNLKINLHNYELRENSIILIFPQEIIEVDSISDDFETTVLSVSRELMGEACSRFEHYVFEMVHANRYTARLEASHLSFVERTIDNLRFFYEDAECAYRYEQGLCQLRSLFCFAADSVRREKRITDITKNFTRLDEHFKVFMNLLSNNYMKSREVSYYANLMNITPKYLNFIVQSVSKRTCKQLIDSYVVLQLKTVLRSTEKSIQEISYDFNFPNQSFLGFYFKKYSGYSPRAFRQLDER